MTILKQTLALCAVTALCACGFGGEVADDAAAGESTEDVLAGEPAEGEWGTHAGVWDHFGTSTYFGEDYGTSMLRIGCGRDPYQLVLIREMAESPEGEVPVRIQTAAGEHSFTGSATTQDVPMLGVLTGVEVRIDLDDPIADDFAESAELFAVTVGDGEPLLLPADGQQYPSVPTMIEGCRNRAQADG